MIGLGLFQTVKFVEFICEQKCSQNNIYRSKMSFFLTLNSMYCHSVTVLVVCRTVEAASYSIRDEQLTDNIRLSLADPGMGGPGGHRFPH